MSNKIVLSLILKKLFNKKIRRIRLYVSNLLQLVSDVKLISPTKKVSEQLTLSWEIINNKLNEVLNISMVTSECFFYQFLILNACAIKVLDAK